MEIIGEFIVNQLNDKDHHNNITLEKQYKLLYATDDSRCFIYTLINDKIYGLQLNYLEYSNKQLSYLDKNLRQLFSKMFENKEMFIKIEKGYVYLYVTIYKCFCLFQTNNIYLENNKELFAIQQGYVLK